MIIGVDAGALAISDERLKVGVYRITLNFIKEIVNIDKVNFYYLYTFKPIDQNILNVLGPKVKNKVLHPSIGWFTFRLPIELKKDKVDIFLGLSQAIPFSSAFNIGFIYDLGFLHFPKAFPDSLRRLKKQTADLVKRSNHIITISAFSQSDIIKTYNIPKQSISVYYPGVDERFNIHGKKFKGKYPYFLFVGSLKRVKNLPSVLKAFSLFLKESKKIYDFIIIGSDKWLDPEINSTINAFRLKERIKFLGFVEDEKLPLYYRDAVSLISPSLWEGFCLPAVEAMRCGCPVIGSNISAIPEIVGDAGILVSPYDIEALSNAMMTIDQNRKLRQKLIHKGLIRAKKYSWKGFTQKIYNHYA